MSELHNNETEHMPEIPEAVPSYDQPEDLPVEESTEISPEDQTDGKDKKKKRRLVPLLGVAGVLVLAALVIGIALSASPEVETITDNATPLSSRSSGTASSGSASSGSASSEIDFPETSDDHSISESEASASDASESSINSSTGNANAGGNNSGSSSSGSTGNASVGSSSNANSGSSKTWVDGWDEQVWVDTSNYQSVYVGENPIFAAAQVCNTCTAHFFGGVWDHIDAAHGGVGGFHSGMVQTGTTPVYENQWVSSGYWTTVHHDGYWK